MASSQSRRDSGGTTAMIDRRRRDRVAGLLLALLALLPVALYLGAELERLDGGLGLPLDDGFIHLQLARNLSAGDGLSYNPGEPVTVSTAPLWTALLSLLFLLPLAPMGGVLAGAKLLGVALHLATVDATVRLARELGLGRRLALLAGAMTLATYWLVWGALSGMELPLFTALTVWGLVLHLRERRAAARAAAGDLPAGGPRSLPISWGVFALATLARPEGFLLLLLAVGDRLLIVRRPTGGGPAGGGPGGGGPAEGGLAAIAPRGGRPARNLAIGAGLALLVLLPTVLVYQLIGGSPLPTTFGVKSAPPAAGGGLAAWLAGLLNLRYLHLVLGIFFKPQPVLALASVAGFLRLLERLGDDERRRPQGLLVGLWVLALPLAYSLLTPPGAPLVGNFGRYFFPLFPPLIALGVLGLAPAAHRLGALLPGPREDGRPSAIAAAAALAATALLLWPTVDSLWANRRFYAANVGDVAASDVAAGRWVAANLPPDALLAVEDIGAIKYLAPQRIVDLIGLASPELIAAARASAGPRDPLGDRGLVEHLAQRRPDFVIAFTNWRPAITGDRRLLTPLVRFPVPGNITMAGDELMIYETRWSRYRLSAGAAPASDP